MLAYGCFSFNRVVIAGCLLIRILGMFPAAWLAWGSRATRAKVPGRLGEIAMGVGFKVLVRSFLIGVFCLVSASAFTPVLAAEVHRVTGKVYIEQVQLAFIGSGAAGKGRLTFRSRTYAFKVVGLGVGGASGFPS